MKQNGFKIVSEGIQKSSRLIASLDRKRKALIKAGNAAQDKGLYSGTYFTKAEKIDEQIKALMMKFYGKLDKGKFKRGSRRAARRIGDRYYTGTL